MENDLVDVDQQSHESSRFSLTRFPKDFFNKLLQFYPKTEEFSFLRSNDKGIVSYDQTLESEMNEYCRLELMKYSDARKFFSCG